MRCVCVCLACALLAKTRIFEVLFFSSDPPTIPPPPGQWFRIRKHFYRNCLAHVNGKKTYRHVDELTHGHADTYSCRRIDTRTHRQAHTHTHTRTHRHTRSRTLTHPHERLAGPLVGQHPIFVGLFCTGGDFKSDFKSYRAILKPNKNRVLSQGARAQKPCNNALLQKKPVAMLPAKEPCKRSRRSC